MTRDEAIEQVRNLRRRRLSHIEQSAIDLECALDCRNEADRLILEFRLLEREVAPLSPIAQWQPMATALKNGTRYLLKLKNPVPEPGRDDLRPFDGLEFVGRHTGLAEDGFDIGWSFAAPVGMGGFPDHWFVGWRPLEP